MAPMKTVGRMGGSQFHKKAESSSAAHQHKKEEQVVTHSHPTIVMQRPAIFFETYHPVPTFHVVSAPYLLDMYNLNFTAIAISCIIYIIWSITRRP